MSERKPMLSGWCANPSTDPRTGTDSHTRCKGYNTANPDREYVPCPCKCHTGEVYECGNCGREIRETDLWLAGGEVTYAHIDKTGRVIGEECAS